MICSFDRSDTTIQMPARTEPFGGNNEHWHAVGWRGSVVNATAVARIISECNPSAGLRSLIRPVIRNTIACIYIYISLNRFNRNVCVYAI